MRLKKLQEEERQRLFDTITVAWQGVSHSILGENTDKMVDFGHL